MAQIVILKRAHFFSIDNDIIDVYGPTIGAIGVAIYAVLARFANRTTGECWPSIERIARTLDLARSTVKVYLHKLKDAGLIDIIERQDAAGDPTSNLYTLLDPSPVAVDKRLTARTAPATPTPERGRPPADRPPAACRPTGRSPADPKPSSLLLDSRVF